MSIKINDAGPEIYNPEQSNEAAQAWKKAYEGQRETLSMAMKKIHEQAEQLESIKKLDKPMGIFLSSQKWLRYKANKERDIYIHCPRCKSDLSETNDVNVTNFKYCPYCRQALNFKVQV